MTQNKGSDWFFFGGGVLAAPISNWDVQKSWKWLTCCSNIKMTFGDSPIQIKLHRVYKIYNRNCAMFCFKMKVFERTPRNTRKIVVATNIAETSITINGIVYSKYLTILFKSYKYSLWSLHMIIYIIKCEMKNCCWFLYATMGCQINVTWQILNEHTIVMFYLKWTSHCIFELRLHFRCDIAMRNWFLQKKLTIVYIYYWKVWSIVSYYLKQNPECAIINYLCTVCLLSSTENSKYTLSWY